MLLTISIVSHGHSDTVAYLLRELNSQQNLGEIKILLTWNSPELEKATEFELQGITSWPLRIIKNQVQRGFAENHNSAFKIADPGIWCVLNPDIQLATAQLDELLFKLSQSNAGMAYPKQVDLNRNVLDYARQLVTPWSLLKRYLLRVVEHPIQPDWVSGCFMAFRSEVYQKLGGFDEKYFLYCEDVDICLRLQLAGYKMVEADFSIVHDTRRGTLKKWDHFKWHVSSMLKLWCSRVFWVYLWNRSKIKAR